jgi:hypothetical protein
MTYAFLEDFKKRKSQVRRYLAMVSKVERETRLSAGRSLDADRLHVMRAGTFLIVYNLVEASARGALEAIYDQMTAERVAFTDLTLEIKREVIKGFKRNADPDLQSAMIDVPVDLVAASLDANYHFSGNVDAKLIRSIAEIYGFSADAPKEAHGGRYLLEVKRNRNDLAHGVKTFDEVGRDFPVRTLIEISLRSLLFIEGILNNVADYLDARSYCVVLVEDAAT